MNIKKIDYISPHISLFYYGNRRHATIFGAILTILLILISAFYIIYSLYTICKHEISSFMFYRSYLPDIPHYYFNNTSGIFHYFQIYDSKTKTFGKYDTKYIRIFMSRLYKTYQESQDNLHENEHWVYGQCRNGIDNKNMDKYIFDGNKLKSFEINACIRYYYDKENHKYISIDDKENFKYPYLAHGNGNDNNLLLETIVEKCDNSSIMIDVFGNCGTQDEIDEYFKKYNGLYLQLLERKIDADNYKNPIIEYLSGVGSGLNTESVSVNNINLSPFEIEIKKGVVYPKTKKIITYSLEENRRATWESKTNQKILSIFDFWIQNSGQVIKGGYKTILDILPSIGGFIQLIHFIFYCINYLYNKYIILIDCNNTIFRMISTEDPKDSYIKKIMFDDIASIRDEVKFQEDISHTKILSAMRKRDSIFVTKKARQKRSLQLEKSLQSNKSIGKSLNDIDKNNLSNSNELINNFPNNNLIMNNITVIKNVKSNNINNNFSYSSNKVNELNHIPSGDNEKKRNEFDYRIKEYINIKNKQMKAEPLNGQVTSHFMNFFNFLMYMLHNQNRKRIFFVLNNLRRKILGEEHIFRSSIILYHLEKYFDIKENKKVDIMEFYENL